MKHNIKQEGIMKIFLGINRFFYLLFLVLIISQSSAQDTIVLKSYDCAIVKLHIIDDCPCSHINLFGRDNHERHNNFVKVSIDSVLLIHVADDFINNLYLQEEIRYLSIPDSFDLHMDTSYIASVGVEFDMNYVVFNYFVERETIFTENERYPVQAGFACESDSTQSPSCLYNENLTKKSIEECNEKYNVPQKP